MDDIEARQLFDRCWRSDIEPAVFIAGRIHSDEARRMIPNDGRMNYFDEDKEHRVITLAGNTILVEVDTYADEVTQMWHLKAKSGGDDSSNRYQSERSERRGGRLSELAQRAGMTEGELSHEINAIVAEMLLRE